MAKDDIKDLLLSKALELISEKGCFTIKELTDATHVNIAAVNYHFGSKDNLTKTIIRQIVGDFRNVVAYYTDRLEEGVRLASFLDELVNAVYDFTVENALLVKYLFQSLDSKQFTLDELFAAFFMENEFTNIVYKHLANLIGSNNPKEIMARYMIFFATGVAPIFSMLVQAKKEVVATFQDQEFRAVYVKQMLKLLN